MKSNKTKLYRDEWKTMRTRCTVQRPLAQPRRCKTHFTFFLRAHSTHTLNIQITHVHDGTLELIAINTVNTIDTNLKKMKSSLRTVFRAHSFHINFTHNQRCFMNFSLSFWWFGDSVVSYLLLLIFRATNLPKQILFIGTIIYFEIWVLFRSSTMAAAATMCRSATWFLLKTSKQNVSKPMWFGFLR